MELRTYLDLIERIRYAVQSLATDLFIQFIIPEVLFLDGRTYFPRTYRLVAHHVLKRWLPVIP